MISWRGALERLECLVLGHHLTRYLLEESEGERGELRWPCVETCERCGGEWITMIPADLLVGRMEDRDPGARLGPWEIAWCDGCGVGPMRAEWLEETENGRECGRCCERGAPTRGS